MTERIDILIEDKISKTIVRKLDEIGTKAKSAHNWIEKLTNSLKDIDGSSMQKLASASALLTSSLEKQVRQKLKLSSVSEQAATADLKNKQMMITSQQKLEASKLASDQRIFASTVSSQQKIASAVSSSAQKMRINSDTARQKLESSRLASDQRMATNAALGQQRIAAATARTTAAETRAEITALRLRTAHQKLNKSVKNTNRDFGGLIRTLIAYTGITLGVREIFQLGDAYTLLQNKLRNVTDSEAQLNTVTEKVFEVANKTRTSVGATAKAFQRFDRAMSGLGASQEESLRLTQTVNELLVLGGASATEQASGLLQLSQAFNKGKLDGDEFRTVMELMPGVADAIAQQLKVTRGELLDLAPEGKITADVMRKALASVADEVDAKFAKLTATIGQAFTVFKNKAIEAFGEFEKKYKVTEKFAKAILWLGDNIKGLTVAAASLISILLVGFGPAIARGLVALKGFGIAIATNPLALLIIGLTSAITYLAIFKDDIKVSEDGVVTFGDTVSAVFDSILEAIEPVTTFFRDAWAYAFDDTNEMVEQSSEYFTQQWADAIIESEKPINKFGRFMGDVLKGIGTYLKFVVNYWIGLFVAGYGIISETWKLLPRVIGDIFGSLFNQLVDYMISASELLNNLIADINYLNKKAGNIFFENRIEPVDIAGLEKSKTEVTNAAYEMGGIIKRVLKESFEPDYAGEFFEDIKNKSRKIAEARIRDEKDAAGELEKDRVKQRTPPKKGRGKSYADIIAENVRAIESETKALEHLGAEYNVFNRVEQLNNQLLAKKKELKEADRRQITNLLKTLEKEKAIHAELNTIYEASVGMRAKLRNTITASAIAFEKGFITADQYKLKLTELNDEIVKTNANNENFNVIYDETILKNREMEAAVRGVGMAYEDGLINLETYQSRMLDLKMEMIDMRLAMNEATNEDIMLSALGRLTDGFENAATSIRDTFGDLFTNLTDGFADSIGQAIVMGDDLGDALENVAKGAMATMISQIVKMGIQWVASKALETGAATTALTAQTAASVTAAQAVGAAWATPAAFTSLASFGANAGPAAAGITSTVGLSNALSVIPGFQEGGYTGNIARDDVAGVVHGNEYVIDSAAVNRIGLSNLDALRSGDAAVNRNDTPAQAPTQNPNNIQVVNVLDPDLMGDYLSTDEGEETVINIIRKNSDVVGPLVRG